MRHFKAAAVLGLVQTALLLLPSTSATHNASDPQPLLEGTWHSSRFELVLTNQAGGVEATSGCCRNSAGEAAGLAFESGCLEGPNPLAGYPDSSAFVAACHNLGNTNNGEANPFIGYEVQFSVNAACAVDGSAAGPRSHATCTLFILSSMPDIDHIANDAACHPDAGTTASTRCHRKLRQTASPSFAPTTSPTTSPTASPTTLPTISGPTTSPTTSLPTTSPNTSGPTLAPTSGPTTSPTAALTCTSASCDCFRAESNKCELYASEQTCAFGFAACFTGTTYLIIVTFDVDYTAMQPAARTSLAEALKGAFCGRMAAAGIIECEVATLVLELTAGPAGSGRRARRAGTTNATVQMPRGTTRTQAIAIAEDIERTPITVTAGNGGATTTSTAASVASESTPDPNANASGSADSEKGIDSLLLVLIIFVVVLVVGLTAMVLRHRYQHTPGLGDLPKGGLGGVPIAFDKNSGMTPAQQIARAQLQQARLVGAATATVQPPPPPPPQQQQQPPIQDETYAMLASKSKRNVQAAPLQETYAALGPQAHEAAAAAAATATPEQETYASLASQSQRNTNPGAAAVSCGSYALLSPGSAAPVAGNPYVYTPVDSTAGPDTETYETIDEVDPTYEVEPQYYADAQPLGNDNYALPAALEPGTVRHSSAEAAGGDDPTYEFDQQPDPQSYAEAQPLGTDDYELPAAVGTGPDNAESGGFVNPTYEIDEQPDALTQLPDNDGGYVDYDVPEQAPTNYEVPALASPPPLPTGAPLVKHDTVWDKPERGNRPRSAAPSPSKNETPALATAAGSEHPPSRPISIGSIGSETVTASRPASIGSIAAAYGYETPVLKPDPAVATAAGSKLPVQIPLATTERGTLERGTLERGRTLERDKLGHLRMTPEYDKVPTFRDSAMLPQNFPRLPPDHAGDGWTEEHNSSVKPLQPYAATSIFPKRTSIVNQTYEVPGGALQPIYSDIDSVTGYDVDAETGDGIYSDAAALDAAAAKPENHDVVYMSDGEVTAMPTVNGIYATIDRKVGRAGAPPLPAKEENFSSDDDDLVTVAV